MRIFEVTSGFGFCVRRLIAVDLLVGIAAFLFEILIPPGHVAQFQLVVAAAEAGKPTEVHRPLPADRSTVPVAPVPTHLTSRQILNSNIVGMRMAGPPESASLNR